MATKPKKKPRVSSPRFPNVESANAATRHSFFSAQVCRACRSCKIRAEEGSEMKQRLTESTVDLCAWLLLCFLTVRWGIFPSGRGIISALTFLLSQLLPGFPFRLVCPPPLFFAVSDLPMSILGPSPAWPLSKVDSPSNLSGSNFCFPEERLVI